MTSLEPSTICVAWTQHVAPPYNQFTWGLGDALRGTLAALQFCKKNDCRFVVDIHRHPISHYLAWEPSELHTEVEDCTIHLRGIGGPPISRPEPGKTEFIYGNAVCDDVLAEDEKELVRNILVVKPEYKLELPTDYSVIHIRAGDAVMRSRNIGFLQKYVEIVSRYAKEGDILCCDSPALKRLCKEKLPHVRVFNEDALPSHIGTDTDIGTMRSTIDDMQIIMNAKKIYTCTVYDWVSNFVNWISKSFDIPLEIIKMEKAPPVVKRRRR
jgi:hypothetical protein